MHVKVVLKRTNKKGLTIKENSCALVFSEVSILGHKIESSDVLMD